MQSIQQIQSIIDKVRITLMDERYEETPELRATAVDFMELSRELNARLGRCGEYLRQGLRGEALEEAEIEPAVLEVFAIFDSLSEEEISRWNDLTDFLELPSAQSILTDIALMLEEAYSEQEPLQNLFRIHRKLALQRAPLRKRLIALRKIALLDPNTEFWEDDVAAYETLRLNQITSEIRALMKSPRVDEIQELKLEISDQKWKTKISKKMFAAVENLHQVANKAKAKQKLIEAELTLRHAFAEMNFAKAESAYQQWQTNFPLAEIAADDPLVLEAIPAISWCEQQLVNKQEDQDWSVQVSNIEILLNKQEVELEAYERAFSEANRFGRPLPSVLENRLQAQIQRLKLQKKRFRILIGTAATIVTATVVGLIAMFVLDANETKFQTEIIARVDAFLNNNDIGEAEKLVKRFENRWSDENQWIDTESRVTNLRGTIDQCKEKVTSLLNKAEAVPDDKPKQFEEVLTEASQVANAEPKVLKIVSLVETESRNLRSARGVRIREKEDSLHIRVSAQSEQIKSLSQKILALDKEEIETRSSRILQALSVLEEKAEGYSPSIKEDIQLLVTRVGDLNSKSLRNQMRKKAKEELSQNARLVMKGNELIASKYEKSLQRYLSFSEGLPIHGKLKQAIAEVPAWKSLQEIQAQFPRDKSSLFPTFPDKISKRIAIAEQFIELYPQSPVREEMERYRDTLGVLENRYEKSTGAIALTKKFLVDDVAIKGLYTVKVKGLTWFYYITKPQSLKGSGRFVAIESWRQNAGSASVKIIKVDLKETLAEPAPQRKLGKQFEKSLQSLTIDNWERTYSEMAQQIAKASQVDPILRMRLLMILQVQAVKGSLLLGEHQHFKTFMRRLTENSDEVNLQAQWADPRDAEVQQRRKKATVYLKSLDSVNFEKTWVPAGSSLEGMTKKLSINYRPLGLMNDNEKQQPAIDIDIPENGKWKIVILKQSRSQQTAFHFSQIGYADEGKVKLSDSATGADYLPGRIVFAIPD